MPTTSKPRRWQIKHGDCLHLLPTLDPASVEVVITDPPYGISANNMRWDRPSGLDPARKPGRRRPRVDPATAFQAFSAQWSEQCLRVLRPLRTSLRSRRPAPSTSSRAARHKHHPSRRKPTTSTPTPSTKRTGKSSSASPIRQQTPPARRWSAPSAPPTRKRFDLLLVYSMDRLTRSSLRFAQIVERLDAAKVLLRSATQPFDTSTPAGRMMVQMLGVFAESERATIVERSVAGMERKAARGEWTAGKVPYGYKYDDDRRFLAIDPTEAPIVRLDLRALRTTQARSRGPSGSWLSSATTAPAKEHPSATRSSSASCGTAST